MLRFNFFFFYFSLSCYDRLSLLLAVDVLKCAYGNGSCCNFAESVHSGAFAIVIISGWESLLFRNTK